MEIKNEISMHPKKSKHLLISVFIFTLTFLGGCQPETQLPLASTPNTEIFSDDLPISTQIQLYELDLTHFKQTILALQTQSSVRQKAETKIESIHFELSEPVNPHFSFDAKPLWSQSKGDEKLQVQWVCSYQSANCARIYNGLMQLLPYVKGGYQLNYFHNPQRFHKYSDSSVLAELCLQDQPQQRELFRQYLWQQTGNLTPQKIKTGLLQRGLSADEVTVCLNNQSSKRHLSVLKQALSQTGLPDKPSLWINKKYISQHHWASQILAELKPELQPQQKTQLKVTDTGLLKEYLPAPLQLKKLWHDEQSRHSWGEFDLVHSQDQQQPIALQLHLPFMGKTELGWVYSLSSDAVTLFRNGELIDLPTSNQLHQMSIPEQILSSRSIETSDQKSPEANHSIETSAKTETDGFEDEHIQDDESKYVTRYEEALAKTPVQPISAQWLEEQLLRQTDLEQQLHSTVHEVDGHPLLKLHKADIDTFYQTLGMQPGDVIVRVNDQWIYEGNNPLWDLLQKEEQVTISLIRKGLPVHLAFNKSDASGTSP